jgi:AmiR/NasT family two-component response regulator
MEFRSVIERAKGMLMERYELTADQFRVLADASMKRRARPPRGGEHR